MCGWVFLFYKAEVRNISRGDYMSIIQQTAESGISPLELVYQEVISTRSEKCEAYRALLKINSLDLGVLMPEQYEEITLRNSQCEKLAAWSLDKLIDEISAINGAKVNFDWISVYIPVRMLYKDKLFNRLTKLIKNEKITDSTKIAFEFSQDILYEDKEMIVKHLQDIKSLGFKLILKDYGGEYCPVSRIFGLPFDSVILSNYIKDIMFDSKTKNLAQKIIDYVREVEIRTILFGINTATEIAVAYDFGCIECIGGISGDYKKAEEIIK